MLCEIHRPRKLVRFILIASLSFALSGLALPAPGFAAKVRRGGPTLYFQSANGEVNTVTVTAGVSSYLVTDSTAPVIAGPGCSTIDAHNATCSVPVTGITRGTINTGDLEDVVVINDAGLSRYKINGGSGQDDLTGGGGDDKIDGGNDDDTIDGGGGDDAILGGSGNDTVHGGPGKDWIRGASGDDTLYGDAGDDKLLGGGDVDTLYGGPDNDILDGEGDGDFVYGEGGNDWLIGGFGNDFLDGGSGTDKFEGKSGNNTYIAHDGEMDLIYCLGSGTDDFSNRDIVMPIGPDLLNDVVINCP